MAVEFSKKTSYRAIREAARKRERITYKQIAVANGHPEWSKEVWSKLNNHLGDLVEHAKEYGWPMPSAIVVPESGELDARALEGFLKAADYYGIPRTTDAKTFLQEQRAAMFVWAQIVKDHLGFPD